MSGTYLHVVGPKAIDETRALVANLQRSPRLFEQLLTQTWGDVRYSHATFVRDAKAGKASGRDVYYLAHALKDRKDHQGAFMDVDLRLLFLHRYWLSSAEADVDEDDEVMTAFFDRDVDFRASADRAAFKEALVDAGLPSRFAADLGLLHKLCDVRETARPGAATRYPMWIMAGWDHYSGHLTGKEMRQLDPLRKNGFLSIFRRAVELGEAKERWQTGIVDRFAEIREEMMTLGDASVCIAISG